MLLDLASVEMSPGWSAHLAVGEASFDDFAYNLNPVYTGSGTDKWPVNGFLYSNQKSNDVHQTLYVGLYGTGYAKPWSILGLSSTNGGRNFSVVKGPLICDDKTMLFNLSHGCPDGAAVDDGKGGVHMVFDWTTNLGAGCTDDGLGYQHCTTPLGPCRISPVPVNRMTNNIPIAPGYASTYGGTLLKRSSDWLVLAAMSTRGNAGGIWALAAMTSNGSDPDPAVSAYSTPKLLLYPESDVWHPHPCEFYPCFTDAEHAFCPCTSLHRYRGVQVLYRAPLEDAHRPESWEVHQLGSLYHWEGQSSAPGIWGQTFSGFVDARGGLSTMYPSLSAQGLGTVNLARAPDFGRLKSRGFWVSAPSASDQITVFSKTLAGFSLNATVRASTAGRGWTLRWNWRGEMGIAGAPAANGVMAPSALYSNTALCFDGRGMYSLVQVDAEGGESVLQSPSPVDAAPTPPVSVWRVAASASASAPASNTGAAGAQATGPPAVRIELSQTPFGLVSVRLNGRLAVRGLQLNGSALNGSVAVHAAVGASVQVTEMRVRVQRSGLESKCAGAFPPQHWFWRTGSDGIAGGGDAAMGAWVAKADATFRTGTGFASAGSNATRLKWNFVGVGARLWSPKGPALGKVSVSVDGAPAVVVDLHADAATPSAPVFEWREAQLKEGERKGLAHGHALVVKWLSGATVADSMQFLPPAIGCNCRT